MELAGRLDCPRDRAFRLLEVILGMVMSLRAGVWMKIFCAESTHFAILTVVLWRFLFSKF